MKQPKLSLIYKLLIKMTLMLRLFGLTTAVASHTYFFGVSDLKVNAKYTNIELIHQFTAHDIENAIAQVKQVSFSPEHPSYDLFIQEYFENNFFLQTAKQIIKLQ